MEQSPRFCNRCGSGLADAARFCSACGAQVAVIPPADTPPPPPPAPVAGERAISVIPNATVRSGFLGFGSKPSTMVITERRIIFAQMTNAMMKQLVADARTEAKTEGKGFLGQWGAQMTAYSGFAARYLERAPDEVLGESPENFAIERSTIKSAKLRAGQEDFENNTSSPDTLVIKTTEKKYTIQLGAGMKQAREALVAGALI